MKKRAMKKWIPKGGYCYHYINGVKVPCKWYSRKGIIKRNKSNCIFANECNKECWTTPASSCADIICRCDYLKYTDFNQDSLLWDRCKECGIKDTI